MSSASTVRVYDASAILAALFEEPGGTQVSDWLERASGLVSSVTYAEVLAKLLEHGFMPADANATWGDLPLDIEPLSAAQARAAAGLRPATQPLGLSLGDRVCLALARERGLPAVTADRAWARVGGVEVQLIR
ncbi:MAG TPA: type II toxin-antitoxin system VapC family toxin [Methylibium sp.]|uniref:type II toxin-antitoxin system VapC family toxin n=1 Tax=Methylibium sp. TaxID=2067992 RepID=UPI002DBB227B|nr:type II toxin-antitoxin system VapC family toxin [Methylibium sp.]HEU4459635.1 type II toxin-antitoxin system VapC family toxin [Methylibium sp.]